MDIEQLSLKKEELPILYETCFCIPIHPKLLDENIKIDKSIAYKVFPKAAEEWYNDLTEYSKQEKDISKKEWYENIFLKNKPKIIKKRERQILNGFWEDDVSLMENGFARVFSISRNAGGSLYFNKNDLNCNDASPYKFSEEKAKEFMISEGRRII